MLANGGRGMGSSAASDFRVKALICMLFLISLYSGQELIQRTEHVILPFIFAMVIVAIIERPVEIIYRFLTGRLDVVREARKAMDDFGASARQTSRRIGYAVRSRTGRSVEDYGEVTESDMDEVGSASAPLLGWRQRLGERHPTVATLYDGFCRGFSAVFMLILVLVTVCIVSFVMVQAALQIRNDFDIYKGGATKLALRLNASLLKFLEAFHLEKGELDKTLKNVYSKLAQGLEGIILKAVNTVLSGISGGFMFGLQVTLYSLFWLMEPLPIGGRASKLMRSYIKKKFIVCVGFGTSIWIYLSALNIDLAALFGFASFALGFIPEIGPLVAGLLPTPIILLDTRIKYPLFKLFATLGGQTALKAFWSNYVEAKLIQADVEMNVHPVWTVLGLMYFGFLFGPVGMLVSAPILAMTKASLMQMPPGIGGPFIACFEGKRYRPSRRASEEGKASTRSQHSSDDPEDPMEAAGDPAAAAPPVGHGTPWPVTP